jgi:hypothetical protein
VHVRSVCSDLGEIQVTADDLRLEDHGVKVRRTGETEAKTEAGVRRGPGAVPADDSSSSRVAPAAPEKLR